MKKLLQSIIENDTGQYKVWVEKRFCHNEYRFYARQISVKAFDQHYFIEPELSVFRYAAYEPLSYELLSPLCEPNVSEYEISLNQFNYWYVGRITELKRRFQGFCWEVLKAHNKIRQVS